MPTRIILARHGETDWNLERRWQGHSDRALNETGRAQAEELAERLAGEPIAAVYSSDLVRAHETARIVAARKDLDVIVDPDLREIDIGVWSGLTMEEIEARFPDDVQHWRDTGVALNRGGETSDQLHERVLRAAHRIAAAHPREQVLVVSHGGALRALALHAQAIEHDRRLENCGVVKILFEDGAFRGHA